MFPKLFFRERLSKGTYRALSRIDTSDPKSAVSAAEYVIRNYEPIKRLLAGNNTLIPAVIREVIFGVGRFPELLDAKWYYVEQFSDVKACTDALRLYSDTRALLQAALVQDWRRLLLKQVVTVEHLARLHDRYIPHSLVNINIPPHTLLSDYGIVDNDYFSVVKSAGELLVWAKKLNNCAGIFVEPSVAGNYVHAVYMRGEEKGLLQINTEDFRKPYLTEFKQSQNREVSSRAWEDASLWLRDCTPRQGELAYSALIMSAATDVPPPRVEERRGFYRVKTHQVRRVRYQLNLPSSRNALPLGSSSQQPALGRA